MIKSYSSATALFEELLKKSVKSILGRYLCGRNNPKITHRFIMAQLSRQKSKVFIMN